MLKQPPVGSSSQWSRVWQFNGGSAHRSQEPPNPPGLVLLGFQFVFVLSNRIRRPREERKPAAGPQKAPCPRPTPTKGYGSIWAVPPKIVFLLVLSTETGTETHTERERERHAHTQRHTHTFTKTHKRLLKQPRKVWIVSFGAEGETRGQRKGVAPQAPRNEEQLLGSPTSMRVVVTSIDFFFWQVPTKRTLHGILGVSLR